MRSLLVAALAGAFLAGCGSGTEAAELATAKCASAVHDELGSPDGATLRTSEVTVEGDDDERRLSGRWEVPDAGAGVFDCAVVPDASDELRGLRVTELEVDRVREPA